MNTETNNPYSLLPLSKKFNNLSLFGLTTSLPQNDIRTTSVKTLLAISHTIENIIMHYRLKGDFYAGFQRASSFLPQIRQFRRLASLVDKVYVFVYPDVPLPEIENLEYINLEENSPLRDEWFIIFNHPEFNVALLTQELYNFRPGQFFGRGRDYQGVVTFNKEIINPAHQALHLRLKPDTPWVEPTPSNSENQNHTQSTYMHFNRSLIDFMEKRNQQLSSLTKQLQDRNAEINRLQGITRRMISDTAWESAKQQTDDSFAPVIQKRQDLTILFTDVSDFVRLSENTDTNQLIDSLNRYLNLIATTIYQNKGDVDKFMGDGVLGFFNNPADAVRAATKIHQRLQSFNTQQAASRLPRLPTRVSLSTGEAILADLGSLERKEVTVIGAPVNLSSRINTYSPENGMVMDLPTFQRVNSPDLGLQDEIQVKGFRSPKIIVQIEEHEVHQLAKFVGL